MRLIRTILRLLVGPGADHEIRWREGDYSAIALPTYRGWRWWVTDADGWTLAEGRAETWAGTQLAAGRALRWLRGAL